MERNKGNDKTDVVIPYTGAGVNKIFYDVLYGNTYPTDSVYNECCTKFVEESIENNKPKDYREPSTFFPMRLKRLVN